MEPTKSYRQRLAQKVFRTVDVPGNLDTVTDIDRLNEVDPGALELESNARDLIWEACQNLYRSGVYPMLSVCIRRRGKILLNRSLGYARENQVAKIDTPACLFSASKAISAVLIHLLAEQGKLNLLDPVSYYIPAFAARGKGSISVLQLLSHRGGFPSIPEGVDLRLLFDHQAALKLICESQPEDHQGRVQAYHAVTSGFVVDELIRVTTGLTAQQYLDKHIRKPMGMRYFRYGLTQREQTHAAQDKVTGLKRRLIDNALERVMGAQPDMTVALTSDPEFFRAVIPSVNLFATAEETTRFYQMLLNQGQWEGKQILQPLTVYRATRSMRKTELDRSLMLPMRYSAGFMLGGTPKGTYGKERQYAYAHRGLCQYS